MLPVMKWCAVVVAIVCACRGSNEQPQRTPTGSATNAAGSAKGSATDPWNATPVSSEPTLVERHAHANKICPRVTQPYFYAIEKAGKVSHILGTRHVGVTLAKFPANVRDELHAAKLAVFEISPDDDSRPEHHAAIAIDKALGPELWKHYAELVGADMAQANANGRPSAALLMMMVEYEDISSMLDMEIQSEVKDAQIPTGGLETSAFQDGLIEKLLDVRALRAAVAQTKDRAKLEYESSKDLGKYCAGTDDTPGTDADARADMLAAGYTEAEIDAMDEQLVFSRNRDWIPKLEKILETDHVFIAVGADHLRGDKGVVALLQARGFKVTRVAP
ncbi:MAG: GumN family protein [Myxococcales bacterium]|nr:GumN family protein [Myxococcales bacterium]